MIFSLTTLFIHKDDAIQSHAMHTNKLYEAQQ